MLKKLVFITFVSIVGIPVFVSATIISILNWPSLFINETSLNYAKGYADEIGIDLKWDKVSVETESRGFINENVSIGFDKFSISYKPLFEGFSADQLSLTAGYSFAVFTPYLTQVGPVVVQGGYLAVTLEEKKKKGNSIEIPSVPKLMLPWWLRSAMIRPLYVEMKSLNIKQADGTAITGNVLLNSDEPGSGNVTLLKLIANISGLSGMRELNAEVAIDSVSGFRRNDWKLDAKSKLSLAGGEAIDLQAKALPIEEGLDCSVDLALLKDEKRIHATLTGTLRKDSLKVLLKTNLKNPALFVEDVALNDCAVDLKYGGVLKRRAEVTLRCPVRLDLQPMKLPDQIKNIYEYRDIIDMEISSQMKLPYPIDIDSAINGLLNIKIVPSTSRLVKTSGTLVLDVAGIPSKFPKDWKIDSKADIDFDIEKFSKLVLALKDSPYGIPAPFASMSGKIELSVEGAFSMERGVAHVPVKLKTELKSDKQRLFIDGDAEANVRLIRNKPTSADLEGHVVLKNVVIQLPDLTPTGIPSLMPDRRIILSDKDERRLKRKKTFPLKYEFKLKTDEGNPLKLLSNLAKDPIPISLDVDTSNDHIDGAVTISEFSIELFRRTAKIEKSVIDLMEPLNMSEISSRVKIDYTDYIVYINIEGPAEKPVVKLSSDPPLSHEDIISTLIFGEPFEQLDESKTDSVSGMNQAFSNKAISLASMFILASTPIEKIGYDPSTNMVSAKFKIAKGTSLTIGGNTQSEGQVGLRHRLGKGWIINTQMDTPTGGQAPGASAFIEWHKRH